MVTKWEEEHGKNSPFLRYHAGETRFDLGARDEHGAVAEAVGKGAVEYHLRRLSPLELNEVQGLMEREFAQGYPNPRGAYLLAARYGLVAVKADGRDVVEVERRNGAVTDECVEMLAECTELGFNLLIHIGQAVYAASQPLRDDEKKP